MRHKIGNKGFSMVELLVGIVILAVIAIPLANGFLTSAKTSGKAREIRNETLAAQDIIESYKATDIAAIIEGLAGHDDTLGTAATITGLDTLVVQTDGTKSYVEVSPEEYDTLAGDGPGYRLYLTNVAGGSKNYDAVLYLDATEYQQHNSVPIVDYKTMDAVYAQPDPDNDPLNNPDIIAAKDFASQALIDSGIDVQYTDFLNNLMNRTITVTIRKLSSGGDSGIVSCMVTFHYDAVYSYPDSGSEEIPPPMITQYYSTEISNDFYSGSYTPEQSGVSGLYFFYYPNMTNRSGDIDDVIEIVNRDNVPASIYLVRQGGDDPGYRTTVNLREKYTGAAAENARMYSNMTCDYRIYMGHPVAGGGFSDYWFNSGLFDGVLVGTPAQNRLYNMTVALYKAGAGFDGGVLSTYDASSLE